MDSFKLAFSVVVFGLSWSSSWAIDFGVGKNVFVSEFVDGPVEAYFERTPTSTTWQVDLPQYGEIGAGIRRTLPTAPNGDPIGKTLGVSAGTGSGAAAIKAKAALPIGASGKTALLDVVKNIPKSKIAQVAVPLLKGIGPWTVIPILADWAVTAGLRALQDGSGFEHQIAIPNTTPSKDWYYTAYQGQKGPFNSGSEAAASCTAEYLQVNQNPNLSCVVSGNSLWAADNGVPFAQVVTFQSGAADNCPPGYTYSSGACVANVNGSYEPISDSDAEQALNDAALDDPAGAVREIAQNGGKPDGDTTSVTGPGSIEGDKSTVTHPDGSQTITTNNYNVTYNNNTVNVTETVTTTEKDSQGNITSQTTETKPPEEGNDLCKIHPEIIACSRLGESQQPDKIQNKEIPIAVTPVSVGNAGSCPEDTHFSYLGNDFVISWEGSCMYATMFRPLVIAMAWLTAGFLVLGVVQGD